jgi:predicted naringenin-chalcone synthase
MTQEQIYHQMLRGHLESNPIAERVFQKTGVGFRHLVVDGDYYTQDRSTQERNERYLAEALPLGEETIRRCLAKANVNAGQVDDFIVVSCTGIDTPGLDLRLAGRLEMRPDLSRTCVLGMGCYAAFPALRRAREIVRADPRRKVLVLAIELCSLHFQTGDASMENVVSSALFADGAAAVLVGNSDSAGPRMLDCATYCDYQTFDHMSFHLTDEGFQMHLSSYVPELLAADVEEFVAGLLARNGLERENIRLWGVHPGSSKILDHVQERLELPEDALNCSRQVLYQYGNMSSPTVLFVLDQLQRQAGPQPGDYGVLMAFGPGLTMESALVQW